MTELETGLLPLYLDGEVSPATREQIAAHLAGCPDCAGMLRGARGVQSELRRDLAQFHARPVAVPALPARRDWRSLLVAPLVLLIFLAGGRGGRPRGAAMKATQQGCITVAVVADEVSRGRLRAAALAAGARVAGEIGEAAGLRLLSALAPDLVLLDGGQCWRAPSGRATAPRR